MKARFFFVITLGLLFSLCNHLQATTIFGYAPGSDSDNVAIIDLETNTKIGVIDIAAGPGDPVIKPTAIAIHHTAKKAYVVGQTSQNVAVIDLTTNQKTGTIDLSDGTPVTVPNTIVIDPATNRAFVVGTISNNIAVLDLIGNTKTATINTGIGSPGGDPVTQVNFIAIDTATRRLYGAGNTSGNVAIVDIDSELKIGSINVNAAPGTLLTAPYGIGINPTTQKGYTGSLNAVAILDLSGNGSKEGTFSFNAPDVNFVLGIGIDLVGQKGYCAGQATDSLGIFDLNDDTPAGFIELNNDPALSPFNVIIDEVNRKGYVTYIAEQPITVIDLIEEELIGTIDLSVGVGAPVINPFDIAIYIVPSEDNDVVERAELLDVFRMFKNTSFTKGLRVQ